MKVKNFPERVNIRRKAALLRLQNIKTMKSTDDTLWLEKAIANTKAKIVDDASGIKSKKFRGKR